MAINERVMPVAPEAIWRTLANAAAYADWVVGSRAIRAADADWPAAGARFHHTIGLGPLELKDHTEALESRAPDLLRMRAKARPLGSATVTLELLRRDGSTLVRMTETPDGITRVFAANPLVQLLVKARNAKSLERLQALAQRSSS